MKWFPVDYNPQNYYPGSYWQTSAAVVVEANPVLTATVQRGFLGSFPRSYVSPYDENLPSSIQLYPRGIESAEAFGIPIVTINVRAYTIPMDYRVGVPVVKLDIRRAYERRLRELVMLDAA